MFASFTIATIEGNKEAGVQTIETSSGKTLYMGTHLSTKHKQEVVEMIQKQYGEFSWDYLNMK